MKRYADLFVLTAGILWGIAGLFVNFLTKLGFTTIQLSALRWIFSAILMVFIVFIFDKKLLKIQFKDIWVFVCTGIVCILLSSTLYFVTIPLATVAVANIMMYTSPIWILIFSLFFLKEKLTAKKIICLILAFLGCASATGIISSGSLKITPLSIVTGLGSGLFYGLYSIIGKIALKKYDSITVTLYTAVFAGIGALFMLNIPQTAELIAAQPKATVPALCGLVILITIAPYTLYTIGLRLTTASRASIICCVEPMTSAIIGTLIIGEPFTFSQFLGIIMILGAGILLQFKDK